LRQAELVEEEVEESEELVLKVGKVFLRSLNLHNHNKKEVLVVEAVE
jgi:hypothetical protein